jgi:hypothetical protein
MIKQFWYTLKSIFNKETVIIVSLIVSILFSRYLFLFYFTCAIFIVYDGLIRLNNNFTMKHRIIVMGVLSMFILSVSVILLKSKNNLLIYWIMASILLCKYLLYIFKRIFKDENLFSLGYLIVYAVINSFLMAGIFRNNEFSAICLMNTLITISIFIQGKLFNIYKKRASLDYANLEYSFLRKFYMYLIPSCVVFFLYMFDLIKI